MARRRHPFQRGAFVVEKDVAFDPIDPALLGADGIVFATDGVTDAVEQFLGGGFRASFSDFDTLCLWLYNGL